MSRQSILKRLEDNRSEWRQYGIKSIALFGSVARDQASDQSDIDILVDFDNSRPIGLFDLARLQRRLQEVLGVPHVDLVTPAGLHPALRERIMREALHAA